MNKNIVIAATTFFIFVMSTPVTTYADKSRHRNYKQKHQVDVTGTVQCMDEPVVRALVYLVGESFMAKTDDNGQFIFRSVPTGDYDLEIEAAGEAFQSINIDVTRKKHRRRHRHRLMDLGIINIECGAPEGSCQIDSDCGAGEFCEKTESSFAGTCVPQLEICGDVYRPVCASDGNSYANECEARQAGAGVLYEGYCNQY